VIEMQCFSSELKHVLAQYVTVTV